MKRLKPTDPSADAAGAPDAASHAAPEPARAAPARRLALLAVDDEPANLQIIERIFQGEYRVLRAPSGEAALAQLRATPDGELVAILSDQRMPGMTGVELLARAAEERPDVARVLVTGYSDMDAIVAAINLAHVMHYVSKPFEPQTIRDVVERAVGELARKRERGIL